MKNAGVYARVSTQEQVAGVSLDDQVTLGTALAVDKGWRVADVFVDEGVSGVLPLAKRPEGARLARAMEAGEVDVVIVSKVDRFTRSLRYGAAMLGDMADRGIGFVSISEQFDTGTVAGKMMLGLLVLFAETERERIAERMAEGRAGTIERARNPVTGQISRWVGGQPPFGFRTDEETGTLVVDPEAAHSIHRVFELRAMGLGVNTIAKTMQMEGHTTRARKLNGGEAVPGRWNVELVRRVLGNRAYIGEGFQRHGETFAAPAILSADEWQGAQRRPSPAKPKSKRARASHLYALSHAIAHVHEDGSTSGMFGQSIARAGGEARVYRCSASRPDGTRAAYCDGFGKTHGQRASAVSADLVEAAALRAILVKTPEDWLEMVADVDRRYREGDTDESLKADEARLTKLTHRLKRLFEMAADQDDDALAETIQETRDSIEALTAKIEGVQARLGHRAELKVTLAELLDMTIEGTPDPDEDEDISPRQLRAELLEACERVIAHASPTLPEWCLSEAARTFARFGVEVTIRSSGDPQRPRIDAVVGRLAYKGASPEDRYALLRGADTGPGPDPAPVGCRVPTRRSRRVRSSGARTVGPAPP
ncbi:MAG: recombinase family protein [Acidimicrobiia bacterium]